VTDEPDGAGTRTQRLFASWRRGSSCWGKGRRQPSGNTRMTKASVLSALTA
jgi:hypothetical protein